MNAKNSIPFTEQDGHQLAADMLREIRAHWDSRSPEESVPDDQLADLWKHDDSKILRKYLAAVRQRRSAELEHGFFAVLTDFIGCSGESSPDPETYEAESAAQRRGK